MRVLLDHCVPRRLGSKLLGHEVATASELGWDRLRNGTLLLAAAQAGFDVMITVDRNLKHQQNTATLPLSVLVMLAPSNDIDDLLELIPQTLAALSVLRPRQLVEVIRDGPGEPPHKTVGQ